MKGIDHKSKFLLTHREREVFELLVQDKTTRDIAGQLFISEKTVRNHISNVMCKSVIKLRRLKSSRLFFISGNKTNMILLTSKYIVEREVLIHEEELQ
ncbi:putative DNA-binding transcriptional regulator [Paenibacillus sp. W2I17]|nr:putative DNA-binding transcriptional regulator [Paenibacillus sp. W2I17]